MNKQKFKVGDEIKINKFHSGGVAGVKDLKPGKYIIKSYRESFSSKNQMVYEFKSIRSNSTYIYYFFQNWIECNSELIKK